MSAVRYVGIDIGGLTVKVATDDEVVPMPAPDGGPRAAIRAVLGHTAMAQAGSRAGLCLAVPDSWLSADLYGATTQEEVRHECEDVAKTKRLSWAGQLAAICAFAAAGDVPGQVRYLVCDVGGTGIRAGMFAVSAGTVRVEAVHAEPGGGWHEFDAKIRAALPSGEAARLPAAWSELAAPTEETRVRADMVLRDAASGDDDALETRAYRITGSDSVPVNLKAGVLIDAFEPAQRRLRAAITAVRRGTLPDRIVLAGGLSWFPLAEHGAASAAGLGTGSATRAAGQPVLVGTEAAARGALLFARGAAHLVPPDGLEPVKVPTHRFRDGLLEEVPVTLPWTESFADFPGGPLTVDKPELQVTLGGRPRLAMLPGLVPGPHLIGLRHAWPGPGVLVVRSAIGDGPVHVVPLTDLVPR
jgi:hypothetical protein